MSDLANTLAVHDLAEKISVLTEKIRRRMYPKSELSGFMLLATKCHEKRDGADSVFMEMVYARACYEKNQKNAAHWSAQPYEMSLDSIFLKVGLSWVISGRNPRYHGATTASSPA
ncbi:hypothetical protein PQR64_07255 [Paraburkholderia phytofirmans]|uniref:hypothetical protein n=1 Tax=Paraburkholderia phytofirmans TaxID=261302 RepID=UPI0038BB6556